jgi:hypothetical protein
MIPISADIENNLIYMCRIITRELYESWPTKRKLCVITLPIYVQIQDKQYVILDEACFFSPTTKMKRMRRNAKEGITL